MRKVFLFCMFAFAVGKTIAQPVVIDDPNAALRDVKGFHAIEVSDAIDLYLTQAHEERVAVSAKDDKTRDRITTEVKNGVLFIWYEKKGWKWSEGNRKLKAYVSFTSLDRITASGASNVGVQGTISGDHLYINLSGASDFKGDVKVGNLEMEQSGASDVTISGTAVNVSILASGASDVKGYDLETETCDIRASGASDIHVSVSRTLTARASGACSITYRGNGIVKETHLNGASSVSKDE